MDDLWMVKMTPHPKARKMPPEKDCFINLFLRSILRCMKGEIKLEAALYMFERFKRITDILGVEILSIFFMSLYGMCNNNPWGKKPIRFLQDFKMTPYVFIEFCFKMFIALLKEESYANLFKSLRLWYTPSKSENNVCNERFCWCVLHL